MGKWWRQQVVGMVCVAATVVGGAVVFDVVTTAIDYGVSWVIAEVVNGTDIQKWDNDAAWTLSALLGPVSLLPWVFRVSYSLLASASLVLPASQLVRRRTPVWGRYHWSLWVFLVTWIVRMPLPLTSSLYFLTFVELPW